MSDQRWAVLGDPDGNGWLVVRPCDVFRGSDGLLDCWDVHSIHSTWEEAMQEADRMARTVTVTLPRLGLEGWATVGRFRLIPDPPWLGDDLRVDEIVDDGAYFVIGKEDCEPLALALLAHARKETN